MRLFNIILGIFSLFGAAFCIFWPDALFARSSWILAFLLFVWGLCNFIAFFVAKQYAKSDVFTLCRGSVAMAFGLFSIFVVISSEFFNQVFSMLQHIVLVVLMVWLVVDAVIDIIYFISLRKEKNTYKSAILYLIIAIIEIVTSVCIFGFYSVVPLILNILIGIGIAVFGIRLILTAFAEDKTALLD